MADVKVLVLKSEEESSEIIYDIAELAEAADGVIIVGFPQSDEFWEHFSAELERLGARWPRIRFIDGKRDTALSSLSLEELVELWREYLKEASKYTLHITVDVGKELSRRDLVRRGLSLAFRYAPLVEVETSTCKSLKYCSLCLTTCPYSALEGKPPEVVREKCVGCGLCTSSCPSGLLYQPAVPPASVRRIIDIASRKGLRRIAVVCPQSRKTAYRKLSSGTLVFEVPCIASFRAHEYLYAKLNRISVEFLCTSNDCARKLAAEQYLKLIDEVEGLVSEPKKDVAIAQFTLPTLVSSFELKADEVRLHLLPLFSVKVDSVKCSLCGACARECSTEAIKYLEDRESASLVFASSLCVGCNSCASICPEKAIVLERKISKGSFAAGRYAALVQSDVARCKVCGTSLGPVSKIRIVERKLRERNVPEGALEGLYLCSRCKANILVKELADYLTVKKELI